MKDSVNIELLKSVENETLRKKMESLKTESMIEKEKLNQQIGQMNFEKEEQKKVEDEIMIRIEELEEEIK